MHLIRVNSFYEIKNFRKISATREINFKLLKCISFLSEMQKYNFI